MTQDEALSILKTGANAFLTGAPGSGKTFVANAFIDWLRAAGIEPSVTAATGIAATHVGGMTLHAWSGIGVAEDLSPADVDRIAGNERVARRIRKAKVLIIEEISMLSAAAFSAVDAICREARQDTRPFGGLTVVLVGDFFQLPPVARRGEVRFVYESAVWRALNPLTCYLEAQHRQDDEDFLRILAAIRAGVVTERHRAQLAMRFISSVPAPPTAPRLFSHNADADRLNAAELAKLPGKAKKFFMRGRGPEALVEALKRGCLSPETLELKKGAAVIFTKNSPQGKFANGTLGIVSGFDVFGMPVVHTKAGAVLAALPMEWQLAEEGKARAAVTQVPLRLAYALTVHKSQGMSMDAAVIDLSHAFEYGQGYVALSRVRRLSGVYLAGVNARALEVNPVILEKDRDLRKESALTAATFAAMAPAELFAFQENFVRFASARSTRVRTASGRRMVTQRSKPARFSEMGARRSS